MKKYKLIIITFLCSAALILSGEILVFGGNLKSIIKINNIMGIMKNEFYFDFDKDKLTDYALTGVTLAADDPYTRYYDKEQFQNYISSSQNSYIGIGVVLGADDDNKYLKIYSVEKDTPSEKAGLHTGDIILEIDGNAFSANQLNEAVELLRRKKVDTPIPIKVLRNGEELDFTVTRESIEKHTVTSGKINENIGYIKIASFDRKDKNDKNSSDTYDEFKAAADGLHEDGCEKIIIDLRNNPGGDVKVVSKIADYLLPEGVVTYTEDKKGKKNYIYSDEACVDFEIVLLVNGGSASASEILTGALKDYEKAKIVGTKTYGKGIVQSVYSFADGSGMSVTTSRYFSPKGTCIHKIGIEPDYYIDSEQGERDVQLDKAVEILK